MWRVKVINPQSYMGTMRSEVLREMSERGLFLSPDALEYVLSETDPLSFVRTVLSALASDKIFVNRKDLEACMVGDVPVFESPKTVPAKNKKTGDIKIIDGTDVTGNSTCEGAITDFTAYFRSRYDILSRIISRRGDFGVSVPIEKAMTLNRDVSVIGIIYEVNVTKNGHTIIKMEDEGQAAPYSFRKTLPVRRAFVNDEVVGIRGVPSSKKDLLVANEVFRPDVPRINRWEPSDSVSSVAFLSDVHVGSYTFLENNWKRMIRWLGENAYSKDIDYLVLPGDVVDGIGVFPNQEDELDINDIYKQYDKLAEYLKDVPDHMKIIIQPGNHDAVRLAEPQPALGEVFTKNFDSNIMMLGNPVVFEIEGRKIQTYHGKGIDDWVSGVQKLSYEDPLGIMREMLRRRHLAPIYGQKTPLAPEKKDYLAMETLPDIFVTGHIHGAGHGDYRGVKIINASAWQSQTAYQKMHNFNPDPGIMPIIHLGDGSVSMKGFMD